MAGQLVLVGCVLAVLITWGRTPPIRIDRAEWTRTQERLSSIAPDVSRLRSELAASESPVTIDDRCPSDSGYLTEQPGLRRSWMLEEGSEHELLPDLGQQLVDTGWRRAGRGFRREVEATDYRADFRRGGNTLFLDVHVMGAAPCTQ